jgi:hypothetical protein
MKTNPQIFKFVCASPRLITITTACLFLAASLAFGKDKGLNFTSYDLPGAVITDGQGNNDRGDIVGFYSNDGVSSHGFLFSKGAFTTFDVPGAADTAARGINSRGDIVGEWDNTVNNFGFLLSGGVYTILADPLGTDTLAKAINAKGDIVGYYVDTAGTEHGFILSGGPTPPSISPVPQKRSYTELTTRATS